LPPMYKILPSFKTTEEHFRPSRKSKIRIPKGPSAGGSSSPD
ncbi:29349_t:CDS:1, partial [Racocetra persica]